MADLRLRDVTKIYADGTLAVRGLDLDIASGELLCVLGPSGCGKSSTLRMIAGLEEVSSGIIEIDGANMVGVPARERDIAMVFENYALYPHLNVFDNIAMPLAARGTDRAEIRTRVRRIAATMGIESHLKKRPGKLSGGERQRVSLARAMIRTPKMFLMDEPLGHLEEYRRVELRREIRALHEATGGTTFYITHDQEEAAAVSDRIAVMTDGVLQQVGRMNELIDRPVNRFVAEFVGEPPISVFDSVRVSGDTVQVGDLALPLPPGLADRPVAAGVRPRHLHIAAAGADGLSATVRSVQPMGEWGAVLCDTAAGPATALADLPELPAEGQSVRLQPEAGRFHLFAADGRNLSLAGR